MVVVLAAQEEHFFASAVLLGADGADIVFAYFIDGTSVKTCNRIVAHALVRLHRLKHILVEDGLKSLIVHAINR